MFRKIWVFLIPLFLLIPADADAKTTLYDLSIFEDKSGSKTIDDIAALPASAFTVNNKGLNAGYSRSVHWLRIVARAPANAPSEWLLEIHPPYLEDVRLYEPAPTEAKRFVERGAGTARPFSMRDFPYRGNVFRVRLDDAEPRVFFVRIESQSTSLAIIDFWQESDFLKAILLEYFAQGAFFGLILIITAINFLTWIAKRDTTLGYYLIYLVSHAAMMLFLQGIANQFLFQEQPLLSIQLKHYAVLLACSSLGLIYRAILRIHPENTLLWPLYRALILVPIASMPLVHFGLFTEVMRVISIFGLVMICVGFVRCMTIWRTPLSISNTHMACLTLSILSIFFGVGPALGVIPGSFLIIHGYQLGIIGTVFALHLAFVERTKHLEELHFHAEEELRMMRLRAEAEEARRVEHVQMISMLAHELKTPLAGIRSATDSIRVLAGRISDEMETRIDRIKRGIARIDAIAERYLQVDKVDNICDEINFRPATLRQVMQEALTKFSGDVDRVLIGTIDDTLIRCDTSLLIVAVVNLVENAVKYSPGETYVDIRASIKDEDWCVIEVADRGPGIPKTIRNAVFQRFVRGPNANEIPGLGIGLALVHKIVISHGGQTEIIDREGGGTVFRVTLPVAASSNVSL